jgi:cytidine deaminase
MSDLYSIARSTIKPIMLKKHGQAGHVACALETAGGAVYTGICIDVPCSIGLCAEQAAIAEMLKHGETNIRRIVAVYEDGSVLPPCGRCRELVSQLDLNNENTAVAVDKDREVTLKELLPERWDRKWDGIN